jgi:hypothetical protein
MKKMKAKNLHQVPMKRRFNGIISDAARLGVSRSHLWHVLSGRRQSKRLLNRYSKLHADERKS